jgi:hypothetical protein
VWWTLDLAGAFAAFLLGATGRALNFHNARKAYFSGPIALSGKGCHAQEFRIGATIRILR